MRETDIRNACEATIGRLLRTPVEFKRERTSSSDTDLIYRLSGAGIEAHLCVKVRNRFRPSEIPQLATSDTSEQCDYQMLFTNYVTVKLAEQLQERGIWFADGQGNVHVDISGKLLLHVVGKRPPQVSTPKGQHFSKTGAKVLHYLLKHGPRIRGTYRDMRAAVGVSIDKIGKLIRELEQDGAMQMHGHGDYQILDSNRVLHLWGEAYAAKLMPSLLLGRYATADKSDFDFLIREAGDELDGQAVVGGEVAADILTGHLRPNFLRLYVPEDRARDVRRRLRLAPSERGTVELCRRYSPEITGEQDVQGVTIADPAFVYAELMAAGDDRLAETAMRLRQEHLAWTL